MTRPAMPCWLALSLSVAAGACGALPDLLPDEQRGPLVVESRPPVDQAAPVEPVAPPPPPITYAGMCRHYCDMLEQTLVYACVGAAAGDAAGCAKLYQGHAARCDQGRCVPGLIEPSLCLRQCDSLAAVYDPVCAPVVAAAETLCPSSPAAHDQDCRAGCAVTSP